MEIIALFYNETKKKHMEGPDDFPYHEWIRVLKTHINKNITRILVSCGDI